MISINVWVHESLKTWRIFYILFLYFFLSFLYFDNQSFLIHCLVLTPYFVTGESRDLWREFPHTVHCIKKKKKSRCIFWRQVQASVSVRIEDRSHSLTACGNQSTWDQTRRGNTRPVEIGPHQQRPDQTKLIKTNQNQPNQTSADESRRDHSRPEQTKPAEMRLDNTRSERTSIDKRSLDLSRPD